MWRLKSGLQSTLKMKHIHPDTATLTYCHVMWKRWYKTDVYYYASQSGDSRPHYVSNKQTEAWTGLCQLLTVRRRNVTSSLWRCRVAGTVADWMESLSHDGPGPCHRTFRFLWFDPATKKKKEQKMTEQRVNQKWDVWIFIHGVIVNRAAALFITVNCYLTRQPSVQLCHPSTFTLTSWGRQISSLVAVSIHMHVWL